MQLKDLKKSITILPTNEVELIHREVRKNRITPLPPPKKKKSSSAKQKKKDTAVAMRKIAKNPEQLRKLLQLLGEDV